MTAIGIRTAGSAAPFAGFPTPNANSQRPKAAFLASDKLRLVEYSLNLKETARWRFWLQGRSMFPPAAGGLCRY
jgi:hypothetical protein